MISFRSKITRKIISYFLTNKTAQNYTNELARILQVDPANLDKKLKELTAESILIREEKGNQVYYSLNLYYPLLKETEAIFNKTHGLPIRLKEELTALHGLKMAYIFGSYAKKTFETGSDIDILLIGEHDTLEAKKIILPLQKEFYREFNIVDMTEEDFIQKNVSGDEFITNIMKGEYIKIV